MAYIRFFMLRLLIVFLQLFIVCGYCTFCIAHEWDLVEKLFADDQMWIPSALVRHWLTVSHCHLGCRTQRMIISRSRCVRLHSGFRVPSASRDGNPLDACAANPPTNCQVNSFKCQPVSKLITRCWMINRTVANKEIGGHRFARNEHE